jgi:hypothetical protein
MSISDFKLGPATEILSCLDRKKAQRPPARVYRVEDARKFLSGQGIDVEALVPQADGKIHERFRPGREARQ